MLTSALTADTAASEGSIAGPRCNGLSGRRPIPADEHDRVDQGAWSNPRHWRRQSKAVWGAAFANTVLTPDS